MGRRSAFLCTLLAASAVLAGVSFAAGPALAGAAADATTAAPSADKVMVYVTSGPIHSDIIIPRSAFANASPKMRKVVDAAKGGPWIIFGWGPYWFGRETKGGPFHDQPVLGVNAVVTTIFPQLSSRLRVAALDQPGPAPLEFEGTMFLLAVPMSPEGLQRSIERISATIETAPDGSPVLGEQNGVAPGVTMYRSREIYQALHNCNHWSSEVLAAGGFHAGVAVDLVPESFYLALRAGGATPVTPADLAQATQAELAKEADQAKEADLQAQAPAATDVATRLTSEARQ
ncbi:MAG TPA: DUF2459 domain-containing protein [Caulobacteraceae bacterium]|nr:DUF2459 domain-containing protein [Caulobacteraceae bacterium]